MTPIRPAISATGLRKSFGDHLVLDGIDVDVDAGTIFALLGPNAAGKTTMVLDPLDADRRRCRRDARRQPQLATRPIEGLLAFAPGASDLKGSSTGAEPSQDASLRGADAEGDRP